MNKKVYNPCNPLKYVNCDKCRMWQTMRCLHYGWGTLPKIYEYYLDRSVFE